MGFQSTVALNQGFGVVGEIVFEGPLRATPGIIKGADPTLNVVGRAFTVDVADGQYTAGGTGVFGGILANPKALSSVGTSAGGPLAPTLTVPNGTVGEFVTMGEIVVALGAGANIGDPVKFVNATGVIATGAPGAGETAIANAKVTRFSNAAAGLAVVSLTGA